MEAVFDWLMAFVSSEVSGAGLVVMAVAAALEYVFPPFPGDTITLLGAVFVSAGGWPFLAVFAAVMVGSVAGSMLAFWLGRRVARTPGTHDPDRPLGRLVARFERHGAAVLVLNRFVPGIRALFFVAAGLAEMPAGKVALYSGISAALWNLGLLGLGVAVGANLDTLTRWVRTYSVAAACVLAGIAVVWLARWWWKRMHRGPR